MSEDESAILSGVMRETGGDVAASFAHLPQRGFGTAYEFLTIDWQGIALSVRCCADWCRSYRAIYGTALAHITLTSPNRQPIPISETGFRSMFVPTAILGGWGGPLAYVQGMLDIEAKRPAWIKGHAARRQLTLF